ncbi:hypothetical protein [Acinetobacter sp. B51(2017)]|uniref:hypothetical protein n=1 Tax=Acinetobacter sp. B51(2017) TaxID=2060938 RepID=UPI000F081206|nr:hypothetical protein [Acinetobacter sp. B51(2017)]
MQELEALLQGQIAPQAVCLDNLVELALLHAQPESTEYEIIDLASNLLLASYLKQAQEYL